MGDSSEWRGYVKAEFKKAWRNSGDTLNRHYRDELDVGLAEANTAVAGNLFCIATGDGPGAVTAAIFWLKTRAGWREADRAAALSEGQTITIRWADEGEPA
jgi:hypothetical protein